MPAQTPMSQGTSPKFAEVTLQRSSMTQTTPNPFLMRDDGLPSRPRNSAVTFGDPHHGPTAEIHYHSTASGAIPRGLGAGAGGEIKAPRPLRRRDSLERREAFLKGKEGSRQRRRWENDRLLSNPHAVPPHPTDYLVPSTHPVRTIPYYLAPLWDAAEFQRAVERKLHGRKNSKTIFRRHKSQGVYISGAGMSPMEIAAINVPKEIRGKLKWRRGGWGRGLLRDLEEDVRIWVSGWEERERKAKREGGDGGAHGGYGDRNGGGEERNGNSGNNEVLMTDTETDEEEIIFAGRSASATSLVLRTRKSQASITQIGERSGSGSDNHIEQNKKKQQQQQSPQPQPRSQTQAQTTKKDQLELQETISDSKLIYESLEDDKSASFARWLVHCLGSYYGLRTWSVTRDVAVDEGKKEVRREAYVGIDRRARGFMGGGGGGSESGAKAREVELPRPLWGMV